MIKTSDFLRKVCACGFASLLAQCVWAVEPLAVWNGFSNLTGAEGYALTAGEGVVGEDGVATIADGKILLLDKSLGTAFTVVMEVSDIPCNSSSFTTLIDWRYSDNSSHLSVDTKDSRLRHIWNNGDNTSWGQSALYKTPIGRNVIAIAYSYPNGGEKTYVNGVEVVTGGAYSKNAVTKLGIGGYINDPPTQCAVGMKVYRLAIYNSQLSAEDVAAVSKTETALGASYTWSNLAHAEGKTWFYTRASGAFSVNIPATADVPAGTMVAISKLKFGTKASGNNWSTSMTVNGITSTSVTTEDNEYDETYNKLKVYTFNTPFLVEVGKAYAVTTAGSSSQFTGVKCDSPIDIAVGENGRTYCAVEGVVLHEANIGDVKYNTVAAALEAVGENETTITLISDSAGSIEIPSNITIDTKGKTLSGTITGSGIIKINELAENTPRFNFGDDWTGTVEIAALAQGTKRTKLMSWGTANSKIVFKGLTGDTIWIGANDNTIVPTIQIDGPVIIDSGSSTASYTLNTVTGSGNLTLASWGGCRNGSPYGVTYTINTLSDYTGTLALENRSTYESGGAFKFAIGNIVKTSAPAYGEKVLSLTRTCTGMNQQLDYDVSSTKLNGEAAPLVLKDDGVYLASAMIGETPYATLQDAATAAENAQTITIIGDVSSEKVAIENKVIYISGAINGRNVDCECEVPMKNGDMLFGDLEMAVAEVTSKGYSPFVVNKSVLFKMHKGVKIESDIVLPPYVNTNSAIYFDATYCGMDEQTLDLNGHTISQTQGGPGGYWWSSVHVNCATVRIVDTSEDQTGKITGIGSCITITGYDEYQGYSLPAQVTLESGTLTVTGKPQKSGSNTYYAENGIVGIFYSGKFIMTGGKIDAVADLDPDGKVAGVIADGAVTTYGMPSVTITGGEIVGVPLDHLIQRKPGLPLSTDGLFAGAIVSEDMITISGGTFSTPIKPEYCADDYYPTVINGVYGVCTNPVAQIGDLYFLTYAEAVAVAKAAIASAPDKDAMIDAIVANTIVAIKAPTEKIVVDNDVAIFFDFSADTYYAANNANATKREALYKKYFDVQCAMSFGYTSSVNPRPSVTIVGGGEAILDAMIDTEKRVNKHAKANYYHMIYTYKNIKFTKDWETPVYGNIGIVFSTRAGTEAFPVVVDLNGHTLRQGKAIGNPSGMRIWQADSGYTKMIDSTADESNGFIGNGWLIGDQNTIAVQNGATFVLESGNVSIRGSYYKKPVGKDYELDAHIVAVVLNGNFIMNGGRLTWKGMDDSSTGILAELVNVYQANAVINGGTIDVIPSDICNRAEKYYWCDDDGSGEPYPYGPYKAISGVSIYWYAEAGVSYGKDIKFVNQVARVGNTYYEDIDAAFEAAYESEDKEITLLHSVDYDKDGNVAGIYNYDAEIVLAASVEKFTVETTYMYYDAKVTSEVSTKGVIGRPRYETKKDTILKHDFDYDWVDYSTCEQVVVDTEHKDTQEALPAPISVETATLEAKKGLVPGLAEKQISEMTATEKQKILEAKEGNGLKVWENIVLGLNGTKHFEVATESESTRYGEVLDLSVPKSELLNTGFEVAYQVIFSNPDAGIEPAIYAYGSTIYLEQPSINPTGLYQVQAIITSGDPNMKPIAINTQNQIGVIKNADEVTEPKTIAVAVPFTGATVENLVNTKLLNKDDELKAYIDGAYAMWSLDENGKWVSKQTVRAGGTETAPNAETTPLKRGSAVWVTTAGQVVTLGTFDAEAEIVAADERVNLLGNPTMTALEPAAKTVGDNVVLMDNTRYTAYGTTDNKVWVTMQADNEDPTVVRPVERNPSVEVGKGYWMIRK